VVPVSLQSRKKFWNKQGLTGDAYGDLAIGNVLDISLGQLGPRGILQNYLDGPRARRMCALNEQDRISFVLDEMEKVLPGMRENFEGGVSKCWDEDEWERGASSWYKPGQMEEFWPHVARPEGRVHFAGDHTSPWIRWMQILDAHSIGDYEVTKPDRFDGKTLIELFVKISNIVAAHQSPPERSQPPSRALSSMWLAPRR
jgi:hypothetical protein